jgi:hypothetical protein
MFEHLEGKLIEAGFEPLSTSSDLPKLEEKMATEWAAGRNPKIADVISNKESTTADRTDHDDHWDLAVLKGGERV